MMMHDINHDRRIHSFVPRLAGPCLGIYRNLAVDHFLETDADMILFADSDMEYEDDTLDRLLEYIDPTERPVISGMYMMTLDEGVRPSLFYRKNWKGEDGEDQIRMIAHDPAIDGPIPEDELVKVDGTGAGCLLIHRSILEAMAKVYGKPRPWFGEDIFDGVIYGEDFFFNMRTAQMGFPTYVHTGIQLGHYKTICVRREMLDSGLDIVMPDQESVA